MNLRPYRGVSPTLGARAYVDPQASVIGDVVLGDDADDDVEDDPLLPVRLHDDAGQPADDAADDQPDDETHGMPSCGNARSGQSAPRCPGADRPGHGASLPDRA